MLMDKMARKLIYDEILKAPNALARSTIAQRVVSKLPKDQINSWFQVCETIHYMVDGNYLIPTGDPTRTLVMAFKGLWEYHKIKDTPL
jgi:hypothetical protein